MQMFAFTQEWLSALGAILLIDLVLAGDNAIVIAIVASHLPVHLQKRTIFWGTVGAIVVRTVMTVGATWLLTIPGLMLIGGLALIWIAYKLLVDQSEGDAHSPQVSNFRQAMKTILVADALMGIDNVLGVAGTAKAAGGGFDLVILGLLISVPIVVWGSRFVLSLIERFPLIIYIGAGLLAFTATKMILGEPLLTSRLELSRPLVVVAYVIIIGGVLLLGWWRARCAQQLSAQQAVVSTPK
jgi:YjbE family integral membrane protein